MSIGALDIFIWLKYGHFIIFVLEVCTTLGGQKQGLRYVNFIYLIKDEEDGMMKDSWRIFSGSTRNSQLKSSGSPFMNQTLEDIIIVLGHREKNGIFSGGDSKLDI